MSLFLVEPTSTEDFARREAGGKGYALYRLAQARNQADDEARAPDAHAAAVSSVGAAFSVPAFLVLGVRARRAHLAAHPDAELEHALRQLPMPDDVEAAIRSACDRLGPGPLAVRSSASAEDGALTSWAGQLDSVLDVVGVNEAMAAVRRVWASSLSPRARAYATRAGLDAETLDVAVVLQQMVPADASGVVFTVDPVTGDAATAVLNVTPGLGDELVSGGVEGDTFSSVRMGSPDEVHVGTHEVTVVGLGDGREESCVAPDDAARMFRAARDIAAFFGAPQDVELCLHQGEIKVVQARPVTSEWLADRGRLAIWDNSNIVESYGGLTQPLSYTYARAVYEQAYVQFCELLFVPRETRERLQPYLENMLGIVRGRIFYNLLNWYRLTSVLPGFSYNRRFMETMMGTRVSLPAEVADSVRALRTTGLVAALRALMIGLRFFFFHVTSGRMVRRFMSDFERRFDVVRRERWRGQGADRLRDRLTSLQRDFLGRWKAPIVNDYLCMVHFGLLKALVARWLPGRDESFLNELMSGIGGLASCEPTRELMRLAASFRAHPEAAALLERTPDDDCLEALRRSPFSNLFDDVLAYIDRYGFRCMDEMKLESRDLLQAPGFFFTCLKSALKSPIDADASAARERASRDAAERAARAELSWPKRLVFAWSLKHARLTVSQREVTRLARTRIYGVVRRVFQAMGEDLVVRGALAAQDDIFWLHLDEVFGLVDGALPVSDLQTLVGLRRERYAEYEDQGVAPRFETFGPVYLHNDPNPLAEVVSLDEGALRGTGCAPGVVEGIVRVVRRAEDALDLDGAILVAERTDPGWVPLYPGASGLLVERGGLLSHSAIVAREWGLPTIVGLPGLLATLRTGMRVRMDGRTGRVEILDDGRADAADARLAS